MSEQSQRDNSNPEGITGLLGAVGDGCTDIWDKVFHTDPAFTSPFNLGFAGTSIKPMYMIMKATRLWGPIGIAWGFDIVEEKLVEGSNMGFDLDGNAYGMEQVHWLRLRLWYHKDKDRNNPKATVESFGATHFVGRTATGIFTDADAPKKSVTDALGKALSMLGFSGDVYMGAFEDDKYMSGLYARFGAPEGNPNMSAKSEQSGNGDQSGKTSSEAGGQKGKQQFSAGYLKFKSELDKRNGKPLADAKIAREQVLQEPGMDEFERQQILSHPLFKVLQERSEQGGEQTPAAETFQ
jgi:hypothetical protein